MTNSIYVLGHRGCRNDHGYENSVPAFRFAFEHSHGLETDIIRTNDGQLFCAHDTAYYDKVTYELSRHLDGASIDLLGDKKLEEVNVDIASRLKLKDGEPLPSVGALIDLVKNYNDKILNLELKGYNIADIFENIAVPDNANLIVSSFGHDQLLQMRRLYSDRFELGALFALSNQKREAMHPWAGDSSQSYYEPFDLDYISNDERLKMIDPDYFHLEKSLISDEIMGTVLEYFPNAKFTFWTMREKPPHEDSQWLDTLVNLELINHVYAIITDFPKDVMAYINEQGLSATL